MEDILLTHAEQKAVRDGVRWSGSFKDLHDRIDEALCRAQVRKVVDWAKRNNCAPLQADGKRTYTAHLVLPRDAWQALKAAREGK